MSSRRFDNRIVFVNNTPESADMIANRGLSHVTQYPSPNTRPLTIADMQNLSKRTHVWTIGDRLWKLASELARKVSSSTLGSRTALGSGAGATSTFNRVQNSL